MGNAFANMYKKEAGIIFSLSLQSSQDNIVKWLFPR